MSVRTRTALIASLSLGALAIVPIVAWSQSSPASGPVARYDMRAGTISGAGAFGGGMGSALGAVFGRGRANQPQHELLLRLGSSRAPDRNAARADHFMPTGARLGRSVPLTTPTDELPGDSLPGERTGRILLYWGCGEHAARGQPVVIDISRLTAGQVPPGLWSSTITRDLGPTLQNSRTFGRWPGEGHQSVRPDSSLLGAHRIAGSYSPEISFTLTKDFMAALVATQAQQPSGATVLSWTALPDATGYHAAMFGGKRGPEGQMGDMVTWSSSATRQFGGGLADWLSPAQVAALVRDRSVLAPAATTCTIPAEVRRDAADFRFGMLTAFGPEEDFAYPPRPSDPRAAWNLEWTARVRHRSFTSWMDMPGMEAANGQAPAQPSCPRRGGLLGAVLRPGC
jgi:hypothetical protein